MLKAIPIRNTLWLRVLPGCRTSVAVDSYSSCLFVVYFVVYEGADLLN